MNKYVHIKFECDLIKFWTLCVFLLYLSSILFFLSDLGSVSSGSEYRWIDLFTTTSSYKRNHPRALQSFQNANLCKDERNFEKRFLCIYVVKVLIIEFHIKCSRENSGFWKYVFRSIPSYFHMDFLDKLIQIGTTL